MNKRPEPSYVTDAYITRIVDGDTIEVKIVKKFNVRLKGIEAQPKNTKAGKETIKFLTAYLNNITNHFIHPVRLAIPLNDPIKLMDFNSFERVVSDMWVGNDNLSDTLLRNKQVKPYEK